MGEHSKADIMRAQRGKASDFLVTCLYLNLFSVFSVVNSLQYMGRVGALQHD